MSEVNREYISLFPLMLPHFPACALMGWYLNSTFLLLKVTAFTNLHGALFWELYAASSPHPQSHNNGRIWDSLGLRGTLTHGLEKPILHLNLSFVIVVMKRFAKTWINITYVTIGRQTEIISLFLTSFEIMCSVSYFTLKGPQFPKLKQCCVEKDK